ncbi:MAG: cation transporter [Actinomycetota bacterium]|nr:cation transporter [Actinomycetota bacterium]
MSGTHAHRVITDGERTRLGRRARLLAGASVTYNVAEAVIAISAGLAAGSLALIGFGLDSVIEVSSGLIILWQFAHRLPETRERQAQRLMSMAFALLAVYVGAESGRALAVGAEPEASPVGIALTVASLLVMPLLSRAQRRTGRALGSAAVTADGTQTALCAWLSAAVGLGLILNATLGWSWADPVAGLVVAAVAAREAVQAWRGEGCCAPGASDHHDGTGSAGGGCGDACTDTCCAHGPDEPQTLHITSRQQAR